jgi:hypothetical protein
MSNTQKSHPLTTDYWHGDDADELSTIHSCRVANVSRAADGIKSISRIVHNSLCEPDMSDGQPLDRGTELALLYALECLGDYIFDQAEEMRETATMHAKFQREQAVSHG